MVPLSDSCSVDYLWLMFDFPRRAVYMYLKTVKSPTFVSQHCFSVTFNHPFTFCPWAPGHLL